MMRSISRAISLIVVAAALWRSYVVGLGIWYVVLEVLPILALIWYPEFIDDLTYGSWRNGYRIDA
jgi:hypothetical protein